MTFNPDIIQFGRKVQAYDSRDLRLADFITPSIKRRAAAVTEQDWGVARILDQGATNHCVGFAWACFGIAIPVPDNWDAMQATNIYYSAKVIDGQPGDEGGTYTRSGVQAFMQYARLQDNTYAWAGSLQDVVIWVLAVGPVITGTRWYSNMFSPVNGLVKVGGTVEGGHEWAITGVDTLKQLFKCTNSWGTDFAINGQFTISFSDYSFLLANGGDAVTATEIALAPDPSIRHLAITLDGTELYGVDL